MNIEQLVYLVEAARTGSISTTAQNLHVSQSAISKSIARLEQDLGLTLFTRTRTGIVPTAVGLELIRKGNEIINKLEEFKAIAEEHSSRANQRITLATVPMFMFILTKSLESFMNDHPHTQVDIAEKSSKEIIHAIRQNTIDMGFLVLNDEIKNDPELEYNVLMETNTYVCVNRLSPLAANEYLTPEDVVDQKIVIYNGSIKDWFSNYFHDSEYFKYSIITNNIETIKASVIKGSSISFLSELTIRHHAFLKSGEIVAVPLVMHGKEIKMHIAWVKVKKNPFSKTSKELLKLLKQMVDSSQA
ncbi:LysR family transcriptional regulator [Brevibacillus agri]|uniref:LysR family transcriptional regulator n=1 Tax=Brevibacillus agri TaxID=51101 RepID=UPI002E1A644A|nr:LysR family transcriptional regulator [Brevibacillus agri]